MILFFLMRIFFFSLRHSIFVSLFFHGGPFWEMGPQATASKFRTIDPPSEQEAAWVVRKPLGCGACQRSFRFIPCCQPIFVQEAATLAPSSNVRGLK